MPFGTPQARPYVEQRTQNPGGQKQAIVLDIDNTSLDETAKRAEIEKKGYTIIANVGNTATDLTGGHAEKTFKLPDYDGRLSWPGRS